MRGTVQEEETEVSLEVRLLPQTPQELSMRSRGASLNQTCNNVQFKAMRDAERAVQWLEAGGEALQWQEVLKKVLLWHEGGQQQPRGKFDCRNASPSRQLGLPLQLEQVAPRISYLLSCVKQLWHLL